MKFLILAISLLLAMPCYGQTYSETQILNKVLSGGDSLKVNTSGGASGRVTKSTTSQDLSSAVLNYVTTYTKATAIRWVTLKASVDISETITLTIDNSTHANYDTAIVISDLTTEQNFFWLVEGDLILDAGDNLIVHCSNDNTTGTVYVTVLGEEV